MKTISAVPMNLVRPGSVVWKAYADKPVDVSQQNAACQAHTAMPTVEMRSGMVQGATLSRETVVVNLRMPQSKIYPSHIGLAGELPVSD